MANLRIEVLGMSQVITNMTIANSTLQARIDDRIQKAGKNCKKYAQATCPVGTPQSTGKKGYKGGTMKKTIKYRKVQRFESEVTTNVNYSKYVEFGTYKMKAQPFFYPAYTKARLELQADLQNPDLLISGLALATGIY